MRPLGQRLIFTVLPKKRWPAIKFKEKGGITQAEHLAIVAHGLNPERKAFYQLAWHLGAAQSDIAFLEAGNVDWEHNFISFARKKTGSIAILRFDEDVAEMLRDLPGNSGECPLLTSARSSNANRALVTAREDAVMKCRALFSFTFLLRMQAEFFKLLPHLQASDAEPLGGLRNVALRAGDGLRVEFRFEVGQHLTERILDFPALNLIHQFCDVG